ncbi:hypothetical protein L9F63_002772, partial [Diploptera punctata]
MFVQSMFSSVTQHIMLVLLCICSALASGQVSDYSSVVSLVTRTYHTSCVSFLYSHKNVT